MPRRRGSRNSNLFSIDLDGIEAVLADANGPLVNKAEALLGEAGQVPDKIADNNSAEELKVFLKNLRTHLREVRNARLSDGRPFTDAAGVVKEWFGKTENRLKTADKKLSKVLSLYASEIAVKAEDVRRRNAEIEAQIYEDEEDEPQVIGVTVSGEPLVTVNNPRKNEAPNLEDEPALPNVQMVWQVKDFNRNNLDIEKLRHYFTDYAINLAINAHIKERGPNQIEGAVYEQVVANKL